VALQNLIQEIIDLPLICTKCRENNFTQEGLYTFSNCKTHQTNKKSNINHLPKKTNVTIVGTVLKISNHGIFLGSGYFAFWQIDKSVLRTIFSSIWRIFF
jgi:hypothetical protein